MNLTAMGVSTVRLLNKPQYTRLERRWSNNCAAVGILISALMLLIIAFKPHEQVYLYMTPEGQIAALASYKTWKTCILSKIDKYRGNPEQFWNSIAQAVTDCEKGYVEQLKILDFQNSDETKRHILPISGRPELSVIITLGVGHDTEAEQRLLEKMGNESAVFYGADPMVQVNEALYSKFGNFFPFAIGAKSGISTASVLERGIYHDKLVVHVDILYFLKSLVRRTFIDDIWIDAEGAEYDLFDFFYKGDVFDKNDITFCQINMEMHNPSAVQKRQIHDFLFKIIEDERYAFFLPVQAYHLRLFLVNFENPHCVEKYVHHNPTTVKA